VEIVSEKFQTSQKQSPPICLQTRSQASSSDDGLSSSPREAGIGMIGAWPMRSISCCLRSATRPAKYLNTIRASLWVKGVKHRLVAPRLCYLGNGEEYKDIFDFVDFGQEVSELWNAADMRAGSLTSMRAISILVGSRFEPIAKHRLVAPRLCYLGNGEEYKDIFDFVDFGQEANLPSPIDRGWGLG
jgi:hypothetical protein